MKRKKRGWLILSLVFVMLFTVVGCLPGVAPEPEPEPDPDPEVVDPRRRYEGTTLTVLLKEGYEIDVIQGRISDFEALTGIDVVLEVYDEPTTRKKFILDATAGTGAYDITSMPFWHFPEFHRNGWLAPLDQFIANYADEEWWRKGDIPASALDVFTAEGDLYAVPHTIISGMTYYRADILEKHGLEPPETTADVLELIPQLKELEPDMIPITGRGAPNFASLGTYLGWAWGYGAQLLDDEFRPHADSPEMVQALTDLVNLKKNYGPADIAALGFIAAGEKMQAGKAILMFDTTGWGGILENPEISVVPGKIGHAVITGPAERPLQWIYMEGLGISSASENKGAAWLFLQWRMSRETTMVELTEFGRMDVPNLYVLASPEYQQMAEELGITEFAKILPQAWEMAEIKYWPFIPEFAEIGDAFMIEISAALAGEQDVPTALSNAQAEIYRILQEAGYFY